MKSQFQISGNPLSPRYKAKRKVAALGMAPATQSNAIAILGVPYIFSQSMLHVSILAFTFGYIDAVAFARFGLFISGQTGNLILSALRETDFLAVKGKRLSLVTVSLTVTAETIFGPLLSCALLEHTNSREKALACLVCLLTVVIVAIDTSTYLTVNQNSSGDEGFYAENYALFLSFPVGALAHWAMKTSFTSAFMTLNFMKTAEFLYRRFRGISQGGPKLRGDIVLTCAMILAFVVGTYAGACIHARLCQIGPHAAAWSLLPLGCLSPLHLWVGGCLSNVGLLKKACQCAYFSSFSSPADSSSSAGAGVGAGAAEDATPATEHGRVKSIRIASARNPLGTDAEQEQDAIPPAQRLHGSLLPRRRSSGLAFLVPTIIEMDLNLSPAPAMIADEFDEQDVSIVQHTNGTVEIRRHE